jgi:hypothetical protein
MRKRPRPLKPAHNAQFPATLIYFLFPLLLYLWWTPPSFLFPVVAVVSVGPGFCTPSGWPVGGSRVYWQYWTAGSQPSLYDIFLDEGALIVILHLGFHFLRNAVPGKEFQSLVGHYSSASWFMLKFDGQVIRSVFTKNDPEFHSKVLVFPYEPSVGNPDIVTIYSDEPRVVFEAVQFCRLPPPVLRFAAVCTANLKTERETVLDWVAWHRAQGFDQAILYLNEKGGVDFMNPLLAKAIRNGSLVLVDWAWPNKFAFHDQPVGQTSCLWRSKKRFKWLGINDLDEIFLPRENETVADVLNRYEPEAHRFGSIACCNRWLKGGPRVLQLNQCASTCDEYPSRQKNIVRVENVDYFCVHKIMLGLPGRRSDLFELVNGHVLRGRKHGQMVECNVTMPFKSTVEKWLQELE